jgi:yecA family protein
MPGTYITDMRHFVPENPETPLPAPAARMRDFHGGIVRAATASRLEEFASGIPCRRRPGNRRCPGSIAMRKTGGPEPFVFWECAVCGDNGRISGFRGCAYDLSALSERNLEQGEEGRDVVLTTEEYRSWIAGDMIAYDLESMQTMYSAIAGKRGIVISASEAELDFLCDATAADANHEPGRKRRDNLFSICDKLAKPSRETRPAKRSREKRSAYAFAESIIPVDSARAHGFLSALVAGPMVMPVNWLQRFLSPEHESIETLNANAQRVMNAYNEIADRLLQERERFGEVTLAIARRDVRGHALIEWQRGFLEAMELDPDGWGTFLSRIAGKDLLQPLAVISQFAAQPSKRDWLADQDLRENLGRSIGVMTVRLWEAYREQPFKEVQLGHATERRQEPKVSRNEPCPCGSGKKYKRCCGSSLRAV